MNRDEQVRRLAHLQQLADLLDSRFSILGFRFGIDSLIGLVPAIGDIVGGLLSLYIVWQAHRMGVPERVLNKMLVGIVIDVFFGSVPVVGDIFDVFHKINRRNLRRIERWMEETAPVITA